jgi:hypothetical protein
MGMGVGGIGLCVHLEAVFLGHVDRITDLQVTYERIRIASLHTNKSILTHAYVYTHA